MMKRKLLLLLLSTLLLQGCLPAVFVAGATAGGAVVYDNRSFKTIANDNDAAFDAEAAIRKDPTLNNKQTHISVYVFNHIALLVGQASSPEQSQTAYDIVSRMKYVKRVYNEITIGQPTSTSTRTHDTWITTKVKTKMLAEKGLRSTQIKVVTENSVVYLMGLVTRKQGNLAANAASQVDGVQKVVKLFEYMS